MRKKHRLLAWALLLSMVLGLMPSLPATVRAANDGDAVVINAMDYGADPTGAVDSAEAIQAALEAAREYEAAGKAVTLRFPRGEYHIYKDHALTREYHTSNTNSIENPIKTIGLLIEEHKNLTIDGEGTAVLSDNVIGTTDDPTDSLEWHEKIAADESFETIVAPSFRPDKAFNIDKAGWAEYIEKLSEVSETPINGFASVSSIFSSNGNG